MPDKETIQRAREDKREGKSASTQAGEFVHREIDQIRKGEHGAKNARQAIAIGLSEARRAGVGIPENPNRKTRAKSSRKPRKAGGKSSRSGSTRRSSSTSRSTTSRRSPTKRAATSRRSGAKRTATSRRSPTKRTATSRRSTAKRSASSRR
ncbi:MAG TPA: DUF6496 domain-containing protein, partial [Usitatibacter sp.]|nr:DUF6496 domain-containing protein [Usitatibacter sp.]